MPRIKLVYDGNIHLMQPTNNFKELLRSACQLYPTISPADHFQYSDPEGDLIQVRANADLEALPETLPSVKLEVVRRHAEEATG